MDALTAAQTATFVVTVCMAFLMLVAVFYYDDEL
jgi:hypothetical protein